MQNIDDAAHQTIYRLREADDWFASLPGEVQDKIIQSSVLRHYRKGQVITAQGSRPTAASVVLEGRVRVSRLLFEGEEKLYMIGERGFWFNFLALITGEKADVAVIADTNVQLLMLPLQQFERILEEEPLYCKAITLFIAKRYAAFMRHFADGQMIVPLQRLRTGLAVLLLLQPPATGSEEVILNVSQADLASILGSSRQTINGLLKQLEKAGLIKIGFRHIRVIDPAGLSEHAAN